MRGKIRLGRLLLLVPTVLLGLGGCNKETPKAEESKEKAGKSTDAKVHDHSEWWCEEHGVPEAECSMCNPKLAAEFQKKGDWCEKHKLARSQCFICDPSLKEKYAVKYRLKYGKEPPEPDGQKEKPKSGS